MVLLLAADRRQARVAFRFLRSLIVDHPELCKLVVSETQEAIELRNQVVVEVTTASFRTIRGYSIAALVADKIAFWFDGEASANPTEEVLAAARPAMATMGPNALLLMMSSPHARRGPLWKAFSRHYGKQDAPVLVWKAPSKTMKPSLPQSVIDDAYEQDPTCASAEFGAEFRSDVETYISREVVEAAVVNGRLGTAGRPMPSTWRSPTAMPVVSQPRCGPRASAAIFARRGSGGVRHSSKDL